MLNIPKLEISHVNFPIQNFALLVKVGTLVWIPLPCPAWGISLALPLLRSPSPETLPPKTGYPLVLCGPGRSSDPLYTLIWPYPDITGAFHWPYLDFPAPSTGRTRPSRLTRPQLYCRLPEQVPWPKGFNFSALTHMPFFTLHVHCTNSSLTSLAREDYRCHVDMLYMQGCGRNIVSSCPLGKCC